MKKGFVISSLFITVVIVFFSDLIYAFPEQANNQTVQPTSVKQSLLPLEDVETLTMPVIDLPKVLAEDEKRLEEGKPPRFAIPMQVKVIPGSPVAADNTDQKNIIMGDESSQVMGTWEKINKDIFVWRLRVISKGALSLNFGFKRYMMPPGGQLFIYSPDYERIVGPFTDKDNEEHGQLWTPVVFGDEAVLELTIPAKDTGILDLKLSSVSHDYKGFGRSLFDKSGSCNIDVICPEGDPWRDQIRSVGVYSTGGFLFCSGALINNTNHDSMPLFLTAYHCGIDSSNAASIVVYWNFETSTCGGTPDGQLNDSQTGGIFRAAYSPSDMTLVELDDPLDPSHSLYLSGWDRSGDDPASATVIHHPNADEKRISFDYDPLSTTSYFGSTSPGDGTHFRVADWDLGTTEPGSSGSPLFSPAHLIVGQLHGGAAACGNDDPDWYGKLSVSWTGGGTDSTRLSKWLDPGNTGVITLDGRDAGSANPIADIKANGSDGPLVINTSDALLVAVELDAGNIAGTNADWWVLAYASFSGWYHYDLSPVWLPGIDVTYQGGLFNLPPYEVLNMTGLQPDSYTFYFGVDTIVNGSIDMDQIYYDSVDVEVIMGGEPFDASETQFIDDTTHGECTGELVATVNLASGGNSLTVDMNWATGDIDLSVVEPDGSCVYYSNPISPNGGQHSGDEINGGIESYTINNGPYGVYTVRAHNHTGAIDADVHMYGNNGQVDLNP